MDGVRETVWKKWLEGCAEGFKERGRKTGEVAVKMPVTLEMRVLISVRSLQASRKDSERDGGRRLFAEDNKPLVKG